MNINRQQVFNKVVEHLLKQNKQCTDGDAGICMYRGPEGTKCAIGALIPDELYTLEIEGTSLVAGITDDKSKKLKELLAKCIEGYSQDNYEDTKFLSTLQMIHDNVYVDMWKTKLQEFAKDNNLNWTHS